MVFQSFYDGVSSYRFIFTDVRVVGKAYAGSQEAVLVDVLVNG